MQRLRLLLGVNVFWLALSMLSEGLNTLVLPTLLLGLAAANARATLLGAWAVRRAMRPRRRRRTG